MINGCGRSSSTRLPNTKEGGQGMPHNANGVIEKKVDEEVGFMIVGSRFYGKEIKIRCGTKQKKLTSTMVPY